MQKKIVLISSSFAADTRDEKLKIYRIGLLGRLCAIFRVTEIAIYDDRDPKTDGKKESAFLKETLEYLECPQYLRKPLFPLKEENKLFGVLPPLRSAGHPKLEEEQDLREAIVTRTSAKGSFMYAGLEKELFIETKLQKNARVIVNVKTGKIEQPKEYWSYKVSTYPSLTRAVRSEKCDLLIGTSRLGRDIRQALPELKERLKPAKKTGIAFGSPFQRGLAEILAQEGKTTEIFDFYLNTIPEQGSRVVKVDEAVAATLAVLNIV